MARIRPSLILRADIDEREYDDDLVAMIKRSYSYISPSVVASHPAISDDVENTIRYDVKLYANYWDEADEAAQANWAEVMPKWLHNMFYKVGNTIVATNKQARKSRNRPLFYEWTELQFGDNMTFAFKTREDCSLDDTCIGQVELGRHLLCTGELGQGVACIRSPSRASYEAQKLSIVEERRRAEEEAKAAAMTEAQAAEGEAAAADTAAEGEDASGSPAAPDVQEPIAELQEALDHAAGAQQAHALEAQDRAGGEDAEAAEAVPEGEPEEAVEEEKPSLPHVNFDPDTTIWGIEYADGTIREYDTAAESFVD